MNQTKPDTSDQAPEVSPRSHDDGPIVAGTYPPQDQFDYTPEQQREKLDRMRSGFTPIQPYPPQYQYQHSVAPVTSTPPAQEQKKRRWVGWVVGLIVGILSALGAGIGIGYAIGENVSPSSSNGNNSTK